MKFLFHTTSRFSTLLEPEFWKSFSTEGRQVPSMNFILIEHEPWETHTPLSEHSLMQPLDVLLGVSSRNVVAKMHFSDRIVLTPRRISGCAPGSEQSLYIYATFRLKGQHQISLKSADASIDRNVEV